jgi:hypothetical protein
VYIFVADGRPVILIDMKANSRGNMGREPAGYDGAALRILVFGDSFTSMGHEGVTWTDLLQDRLEARLGVPVSVVNFGRDGYGLLQMFDLAAIQVERLKPDYVLFAFITDDLGRSRSWWWGDEESGRLFRFESPPLRTDLAYAEEHGRDAALIDARATKEWFTTLQARPDPADPVLTALQERREALDKARRPVKPEVSDWTSSMLYNRIVHGHPYGAAGTGPSRPPFRTDLMDLGEDHRFVAQVAKLNALGVPYDLVHFPIHPELVQGQYRFLPQEATLHESLSRITGKMPVSLLSASLPASLGTDDPAGLFMLPDNHPSAAGMAFYAEAVSEWVVARQSAANPPVADP